MELDAKKGTLYMAERHDHAIVGPGGYAQGLRKSGALRHQGMVTTRLKRRTKSFEKARVIVLDRRRFAMTGLRGSHHPAPESGGDRLVPETDAQRGYG